MRDAGMIAGLVCQSSVNGQSERQAARMRFAGGFSPDGQRWGREAERKPRAKLGAGRYSLAKSVNGASDRGQDRDGNTPKTESEGNPHGGQYWLAEMPLTEF